MFQNPIILPLHPIQNTLVEWFLEPLPSLDTLVLNVFDPRDLDVILRLEGEKAVHGYWHEGYRRLDSQSDSVITEVWEKTDVRGMRVRFVPQKAGQYHGVLEVFVHGLLHTWYPIQFVASPSSRPSFLASIDLDNHRTFLVDKKTFLPIGQNLCWPRQHHGAISDYRHWLDQIASHGGNFVRIWLTIRNFSLVGGSFTDFSAKMIEMAKLEAVLNLCAERNIHFMLCTMQHGLFSRKVNPAWDHNPWNVKNGGHLADPWLFFTDSLAKAQYHQMLTYYLRRFGHFDHLFAWELWNEVDWTDEFNDSAVTEWHREMSQFIHENDPAGHLVTTSYKSYFGQAGKLDSIDFVNPHSYDYVACNALTMMISTQGAVRERYLKPVLHSEIGLDWRSGHGTLASDPQGICFLQGLLGIFAGGAGAAMQWWWDTYVEELGLYRHYEGIAEIAKHMDLSGPSLCYLNAIDVEPKETLSACGYTKTDSAAFLIFAKEWQYAKPDIGEMSDIHVKLPMPPGKYHAEVRETTLGKVLTTFELTSADGMLEFTIPSLHNATVVLVSKSLL